MTIVDDDESSQHEQYRRSRPVSGPNPWVVGLAGICAYEVFAGLTNALLGTTVLPSVTTAVETFTWSAFGRRLVPRWGPTVALVVVASVASAVIRKARPQPSKR
jgi:hypothetical protein